jgi:nitrite reductase/ring-hydroxylating ferredoxin subunit
VSSLGLVVARRHVFACSVDALQVGRVHVVRLGADEIGRPREALVVVDSLRAPRAYLNLCRHLPIPLDGASRDFLAQGHLQCITHGARYRLEDGLCVAGPCRGKSLHALELRLIGYDLFVVEP